MDHFANLNGRLPQWLEERLRHPLPGPMVGSRFEPRPVGVRHYGTAPHDARGAAVLALLYQHNGQWMIPLTVRAHSLQHHGGQISLPGGRVEPNETSAEAAVREFHEELGGQETFLRLLGTLSPIYVSASNFRIVPWVAVAERRPVFSIDRREVHELLEVPVAHLLDPLNFGEQEINRGDERFVAPFFTFYRERIWGATCMLLGELITIISEHAPAEPQ